MPHDGLVLCSHGMDHNEFIESLLLNYSRHPNFENAHKSISQLETPETPPTRIRHPTTRGAM
jgi:hypothetical protein